MTKVVFDTTIFLRAAMNPSGWWGRLVFETAVGVVLVISLPIMREVVDVVTRPELVKKYRGLAERDVQRVLSVLAAAEIVKPADIPPVCRDPKDDVFLATAVAAGAAYLVSEDRDLLDMGEYEGVKIVDSAAFLAALG